MNTEWFAQASYRCRLEWGRDGAREAAARGDILVVVDTLRFSTAAVTAVHRGGFLYPCLETEAVADMARRVGAEVGGHRAGQTARFSLSPLSYLEMEPGTRIALASPNGATCVRYAADVPFLFVGTLINAEAAAAAMMRAMEGSDLCATVLACGEHWEMPGEDGPLRTAVEDYLGAGAILASLHAEKSPECRVCEGAFQSVRDDLEAILWDCGSGRELRDKGRNEDVRFAARLNRYDSVPVLRGGRLEKY